MHCDYELLAHKLQRWNNYITNYHLPEWDAIPDFGLYMDQVIVLLEGYLSFIPTGSAGKDSKDQQIVTSSTINNYVRLRIMPAPVKRKYFRVHIAYALSPVPVTDAMEQAIGARRSPIWRRSRASPSAQFSCLRMRSN